MEFQKFHEYLYERKFILVTNHKPLTIILGPKNGVPYLAAAQLQCWAIQLSAYNYDIEFCVTDKHVNTDGPSRLSLQGIFEEEDVDVKVFQIPQLQ